MTTYFRWLDGKTLEGTLDNIEATDASQLIEEFMSKLAERQLGRVNLMLDISRFALTTRNITVLSNFMLVVHEDRRLAWGVLYGSQNTLLKILGASITYSLGIRLKATRTREEAYKLLHQRQSASSAS